MDKNNLIEDSFHPVISVIIPIYNNTPFDIKRCIDSILGQSFIDYEVIIIDDGSTKECADFIEETVQGLSKFVVIHQPNCGVSTARNVGVSVARGKYVIFVDADDVITPHFFYDISCLSKYSFDVAYGFVKYIKKDELAYPFINSQSNKLNIESLNKKSKYALYQYMIDCSVSHFRDNDLYVHRGPVAKVLRREVAKCYKFDKNLSYGEDAIWNLNLLSADLDLIFVKKLWYLYIENPQSVTHKYTESTIDKYEKFLKVLWKYSNNGNFKINFLNRTLQLIGEINYAYFLTKKNMKNVSELDLIRLIKREPWNFAFKWKYAVRLKKRGFFKFLLLKLKVLPIVYRLMNIF